MNSGLPSVRLCTSVASFESDAAASARAVKRAATYSPTADLLNGPSARSRLCPCRRSSSRIACIA